MARGSRTQFRSSGKEITHQQHETDSPAIPVQQLEKLHAFKPEAVDWMLKQTEIEADYRRVERRRINTFVFIENMAGQIFAWTIGIAGLGFGAFVVMKEQLWAGGSIIVSAVMVGLAAAFFKGRK